MVKLYFYLVKHFIFLIKNFILYLKKIKKMRGYLIFLKYKTTILAINLKHQMSRRQSLVGKQTVSLTF